jgi:hypothetical protein
MPDYQESEMASGYNLGDLRVAIEDANRQVLEELGDGVAPNDLVLTRLKQQRSTLIKAFAPQLIDMALTKLLNDVCRLKRSAGDADGHFDLFGGFGKIPKRVTIARGKKKDPAKLTIAEARQWLELHSERTAKAKDDDLKKVLRDCLIEAQSENETVSQVILRQRRNAESHSKELEFIP